MVATSDTSPLRYLIAIERAQLLGQLFTQIYIPPAVVRELSHASTPPLVRE